MTTRQGPQSQPAASEHHASSRRQHLLTLLALGAATAQPLRAATADPIHRSALTTPRALGAVLLALTRAGSRLVAVGERGVVLLSDDIGKVWRQVAVPVSTTLTAVRFATPDIGLAVGHAGVVLRTGDGGLTWELKLDGARFAEIDAAQAKAKADDTPASKARQANSARLVADGADKPWLALHVVDAAQAWILGAYGLLAKTSDGGQTWQSWGHRLDNPKGQHLNAVAVRGATMVVVGEGGTLWRSDDAGDRFVRLSSPYTGSWFAAALLESGRLVVAGLRGNTFVSDDRGATFVRAALPTPVTVSTLVPLRDGRLLALTQSGDVSASDDLGSSFKPLTLPPGAPLTDLVEAEGGALVGASFRGPRQLAPTPALAAR